MSAIAPRLELRQGQSLVMTQQLQQSIKLLQLSSQELHEYIEQELEKNPLLAVEEAESDSAETVEEGAEVSSAPGESEESTVDAETEVKAAEDWQEADAPTHSDEAPDYEGAYEPRASTSSQYSESDFVHTTASEVSLRDHLLDQLNLEVSDPVKRIIGQHLIDLVDESGYIKEDVSSVAELLNCPMELIDATFTTLHTFDPPGVCARSLAECLSIQLRDKNRLDPAMEALLLHLELVAKGDKKALSKLCGVDEEDIAEMCAEIRALNPRPGSGFQHEAVQAVQPEVFLRPTKAGGWNVELNNAVLPRVLVNRRYHTELSVKALDKLEKKYLSDQYAAANWLVKALDSRAQTILKVSTEIVAQQDAFFRQGIKYLRPLTLKEVAAAVELHESTVSRVTTAKFMATPRGTYELKYFFNASIGNSSGGENYSNKTVQFLIKELIDKEETVLSDDAIAELLKARDIDIARRTVAKYRELMKIPPSSVRKREKKVG